MDELKLGIHNINGLDHKTPELKFWLNENPIDVLAINEPRKSKKTYIKSSTHSYRYSQPEKHVDKGIGILYKNTIETIDLPQIESTETTKNLNHSILITANGQHIQITTIYCPKGKPNLTLFSKIMDRYENTIIMGDMNVQHDNIGSERPFHSNRSGDALFELTEGRRFSLLNDHTPNHYWPKTHKETVKSLIFVSNSLFESFLEFEVHDSLGSDHSITTATLALRANLITPRTKTVSLYHKANWEVIGAKIQNDMSDFSLNHLSSLDDIDTTVRNLAISTKNNEETMIFD